MPRILPTAFVGVVVCLAVLLQPASAAGGSFITIGTGGPIGGNFQVGNSICRMVHQETRMNRRQGQKGNLRCAAPSTEGSVANIRHIRSGDLDFGVVQSDAQFHAYHGSGGFSDEPFEGLRAVFSIYPEPLHLLVGKGSGIGRWRDLKGKRINIGNPGSGQRGTLEMLMAAHGATVEELKAATEMPSTVQFKALCDGKIDALGYTVGIPNAGVAVAVDGCGARLLNLDGDIERQLVDDHPFFAFATIPGGTYKTIDADVTTIAVSATLVTSVDQPDDVVYKVVRAVFDNLDDFRKLYPALLQLDPIKMISDGLTAPLHPGAERFYREMGWM